MRKRKTDITPCMMWLVGINIVVLWVVCFFLTNDGAKSYDLLRHDITAMQDFRAKQFKIRKNIYCVHLEHLVKHHGADEATTEGCNGHSEDDIQDIILYGAMK